MRHLKQELGKIPSGLVELSVLEKAKVIAAGRISELIKGEKFHHFNLNKLKPFEKRRSVVGFYGDLFENMPEEISLLLVVIYWLHDIGFAKTDVNSEHGKAAVLLLREWGIMELFDVRLQAIIGYAIENHNIAKLPELPSDADELSGLKDIFARVLRDWDKLGGFIGKSDGWIFDKDAKQRETDYRHSVGEAGAIIPAAILNDFERFDPIDWGCVSGNGASYESIALLFFAWMYDINYRETLGVLVDLKIPDKFLGYFKERLVREPRQYGTIEKTFNSFLKANGF